MRINIIILSSVIIVNLFLCLKTIISIYQNKSIRKLHKGRFKSSSAVKPVNVALLFPVHDENSVLKNKLSDLIKLSTISNVSVFVIGDACTFLNFGYSTKSLSFIRDPSKFSTKVSKLNYALQQCKNANYIGVFDIDTRVMIQDIDLVLDIIHNHSDSAVVQMIPASVNGSRRCTRGIAVAALRRSLGVESRIHHRSTRIKYLMGSGLFLKVDTLQKMGNFPSLSDDLELSHAYLDNKLQEIVTPLILRTGFPLSFHDYFIQYLRIFQGMFSFHSSTSIQTKIVNIIDACKESMEGILILGVLIRSVVVHDTNSLLLTLLLCLSLSLVYSLAFFIVSGMNKIWQLLGIIIDGIIGFPIYFFLRLSALVLFFLRKLFHYNGRELLAHATKK